MLSLRIGSFETVLPEECSQIGLLDSKHLYIHNQLLAVSKYYEIIWQGLHMSTAKCLQSM